MTVVYADSSAVLDCLLNQKQHAKCSHVLATAERVVASRLTWAEVGRALTAMAHRDRKGDRKDMEGTWLRFQELSAHWQWLEVDAITLGRVPEPLRYEPVRTLDAIHLASIALFDGGLRSLVVLTSDDRVIMNARAMGLTVEP